MSASEVATIGAVVLTLTQIIKRAIPGDGYGVYIAGGVSFVVVLVWVLSGAVFPPARTDLWGLFSGWVAVFATAAGLHSISSVATSTVDVQRERLRRTRVQQVQEAA